MPYTLPELPYAYDALEPYIDKETMEIHHTKHHQGYVNKLNKALEGHEDWQEQTLDSLLADLDDLPESAGMLTPATAMGDALLKRLVDNAGLTFTYKGQFSGQFAIVYDITY